MQFDSTNVSFGSIPLFTSSVFFFKFASLFIGISLLNFQQWSHKARVSVYSCHGSGYTLYFRNLIAKVGDKGILICVNIALYSFFIGLLMNRELRNVSFRLFFLECQFHVLSLINEDSITNLLPFFFYSDEIRSR